MKSRNFFVYACRATLALATFITMSGCIPAAFVGGAALGGSVVYDNRSVSTILADQKIEHKAQLYIDSDVLLKHDTHISAYAFDQHVLLVGQVHSLAQRLRAAHIVHRIKGVHGIYNQLVLGKPTALKKRTHDIWITTHVKSVLLAQEGLRSTRIKVVTENQTVFLFGAVKRRQGRMAINVVRTLPSVRKVVAVFEYIS